MSRIGRLLRAAIRRGAPLAPSEGQYSSTDNRAATVSSHDSTSAAGRPVPQEYSRCGSYRILEFVGEGGMGKVFKAEDVRLRRLVALKFLPVETAQDEAAVSRLRLEARAASALNHPNICTIYEIGECEAGTFIAMEWLEGESLRDLLRRKALPPERLLKLAWQMADGLSAAHDRQIIHRDIKPENLFVLRDDRVKLLDFGIAKSKAVPAPDDTTHRPSESLSQPGMVIGSLHYMSPEQARGEDVDVRTDLFSLAAVIYEMGARRRAFPGSNAADVFAAMAGRPAALPANMDPRFKAALQAIVDKGLEKNRDLRYQDAADLAADLRRVHRDLAQDRLPAVLLHTSEASAERSFPTLMLADLSRAAAVAALALVTHQSLSNSAAGKYLEQFQLAYLQNSLAHGALDESDFDAGGRYLPLVIDLSSLHPDKHQPTDRRVVDAVIAELRRNGARAIGIDLSFDDLQPADFQYFSRWLAHRNVRIGVYRRAVEKREAWLGRQEFSDLAAGIAMPADNPQYAFAFSRRWSARSAITERDRAEPLDCAAADTVSTCKEDLYQLPVALWLLANREAFEQDESYESESPESRVMRAVGPLEPASSERTVNATLELAKYPIDYSYLKALRRDTITLTSGSDEIGQIATDLKAHRAAIDGRLVLVGDLEDTSDHLCYTSQVNPLAGAFVHACALATLNRGMLLNPRTRGRRWTWTMLALLLGLIVVGLRLTHRTFRTLRQVPHQHLEMVVFGMASALVIIAARLLASRRGIVWPELLYVAGVLAVFSISGAFCRALTAVPRAVHLALTQPEHMSRGV